MLIHVHAGYVWGKFLSGMIYEALGMALNGYWHIMGVPDITLNDFDIDISKGSRHIYLWTLYYNPGHFPYECAYQYVKS